MSKAAALAIGLVSAAALVGTSSAQAHGRDRTGAFVAGAVTGVIIGGVLARPHVVEYGYHAPPPPVYVPPPPPPVVEYHYYYPPPPPPRVIYYPAAAPAYYPYYYKPRHVRDGRHWRKHDRRDDDDD